MFAAVLALTLSKISPAVECGGSGFWFLTLVLLPIIGGFSFAARRWLLDRHALKVSHDVTDDLTDDVTDTLVTATRSR